MSERRAWSRDRMHKFLKSRFGHMWSYTDEELDRVMERVWPGEY